MVISSLQLLQSLEISSPVFPYFNSLSCAKHDNILTGSRGEWWRSSGLQGGCGQWSSFRFPQTEREHWCWSWTWETEEENGGDTKVRQISLSLSL